LSLLFQCYLSPSALHSFPTRRSSDLSGGWRQSSYHPRLTISLRTPVVLPPTLAITDWRGNVSRKVEASSLGTQKPESATQRGSRQRCICVGTRRRLAGSKSLLRSKASAAAPSTPP